jgi:hypothetical protein
MRALDLEPSHVLLEKLQCGLTEISNRAAALSSDVGQEHGDELGYLAIDTARLSDIVSVLQNREEFPPRRAGGLGCTALTRNSEHQT